MNINPFKQGLGIGAGIGAAALVAAFAIPTGIYAVTIPDRVTHSIQELGDNAVEATTCKTKGSSSCRTFGERMGDSVSVWTKSSGEIMWSWDTF